MNSNKGVPTRMSGSYAPLVSNEEIERLIECVGGLNRTQQDSLYEILVRVRGTYERERDALLTARRAERRMFEDLTPGGSEFHDSPRAVANWLKDRLKSGSFSVIVELKRERDTLRQQLADCRSLYAELRTEANTLLAERDKAVDTLFGFDKHVESEATDETD